MRAALAHLVASSGRCSNGPRNSLRVARGATDADYAAAALWAMQHDLVS